MEEGSFEGEEYKVEAGTVVDTKISRKNSWQTHVDLDALLSLSFTDPVILGGVVESEESTKWSSVWSQGASRSSIASSSTSWIGRMIGEDTDRSRASGTIAYIVLEGDTTHVMSGATVYAMKTEREVSGNPRTLSIPGGDTAVATQSSMYGGA